VTTRAAGPLVVSSRNPRYFTPATGEQAGRAVYLTGSHIWNNLHDGMGPGAEAPDEPERLDFDAYLRFLTDRGHNFIRLWRWEQIRSQAAGGDFHLNMTPQPWARTGSGTAKDGQPRFDLEQWEPTFFERLRERVVAAGEVGVYVGVMLFDGWALHLSPAPDQTEGHPFHALNNVNGVAATSIDDLQVLPLDPRIEQFQLAYIRNVVDVLHDLPNVLWEVANESTGDGAATQEFADFLNLGRVPSWGNSTAWQYWVIDVVKDHEAGCGYDAHPIGMTMQFPVADQTRVNEPLLRSRADWISPGYDDDIFADGRHPMAAGSPPSRWYVDPPVTDAAKVIITDTDHYAPGHGDALWAWKSFLRGHHPILMDFGLIGGLPATGAPAGSDEPSSEAFEPARWAMGDTRRYADRIDLIAATPDVTASSTRYALVNPGVEYLVLQPDGDGRSFTVTLPPGTYEVGWFGVTSRTEAGAGVLSVGESVPTELTSPFPTEPSVVHLRRTRPDR
jgi:hypothetical protein